MPGGVGRAEPIHSSAFQVPIDQVMGLASEDLPVAAQLALGQTHFCIVGHPWPRSCDSCSPNAHILPSALMVSPGCNLFQPKSYGGLAVVGGSYSARTVFPPGDLLWAPQGKAMAL